MNTGSGAGRHPVTLSHWGWTGNSDLEQRSLNWSAQGSLQVDASFSVRVVSIC